MIDILVLILTGAALGYSIFGDQRSMKISSVGSRLRSELGSIAKEISNKMSKNSNLLTQIYQAYQVKNTNLLNRIFTGMGFGPRMQSLVQQIDKNDQDYAVNLKKLNAENAELEKQLNEVNTAINNTGASETGNRLAQETIDKYNSANNSENLEQNVKGGIE